MTGTLFTNVNILDASGADPFPGQVLVEGNRISALSRHGETLSASGAQVIDGGGTATLMPGLIESHAHLSIDNTDDLAKIGMIPPEENTLITMRNARFYLDCGITSCISAAAAKPRLDVVIRNEINAGRIPGPRMLACTPQFITTGGPWDARQMHLEHHTFEIIADGPDECVFEYGGPSQNGTGPTTQRIYAYYAVEDYAAGRRMTIRFLRTLTETDWTREGHHSERGIESVRQIVTLLAAHDIGHERQIVRIRETLGA